MLYTKKIDEITYKDITAFCDEQITENISLDYKELIDSGLAKTIAAMANTWGGLIVIGVEDDNSKPKLPVKGIENKDHIREQINNVVLGNITPPVFPEIQICPSDDAKTALVVIRIPQSNSTPHAIRGNTRVYLRTDTSNEPEELATIDRLLWLVNKRNKSVELKNGFSERADTRFKKLTGKNNPIEQGEMILSASPLYPYEPMIDYRKLRNGILGQIRVSGFGQDFPVNVHHTQFEPTQDGSYSVYGMEHREYLSYEELNHFGFFYHRSSQMIPYTDDEGKTTNYAYPIHILVAIDLFLQSMEKFYSELGYWGFIEINLNLNNVGKVSFKDLPPPRGYHKLDNQVRTPIDNNIRISKEMTVKDLATKRMDLVVSIFTELAWSIGFSWIDEAKIKQLFEKGW